MKSLKTAKGLMLFNIKFVIKVSYETFKIVGGTLKPQRGSL
jgi:hypothetical protein